MCARQHNTRASTCAHGRAENIWPRHQTEARQPSFRPPHSNIAFGDARIGGFVTSYSTNFDAPFERMKKIRSPMRNEDLAKAVDLHPLYLSSFNRVTEYVTPWLPRKAVGGNGA